VSDEVQQELETAIRTLHYGANYAVVSTDSRAAIEELHSLAAMAGIQIQTVPNGDGGLNIWRN
jgi:hypothetical protein